MQEPTVPQHPKQPLDDHLLEDLAAVTGLFNPEKIWQQEAQLEDMSEKEEQPQK